MSGGDNPHKSALLTCIQGTLSPEAGLRRASEEKLTLLEVTDQYPINLLEIVLDGAEVGPIRQLASVLLRQYVDSHWSNLAEKFIEPIPNAHTKSLLRSHLPSGLSEPNSKIRNSIVQVIIKIAHWDWPEAWPELLDVLVRGLKDEKTVNGAMRVLGDLAKELTDAHVVQIVPGLFGEMLRILEAKDQYSLPTRCKAVEIFKSCQMLLHSVGELDKSIIKTIFLPSLEPFLLQFIQILQDHSSPTAQSPGSFGLKKTVIRTIGNLLYHWPRRMSPYLSSVLPPIWKLLETSGPKFSVYLAAGEDDDDNDNGADDGAGGADFEDDCESWGVESMVYAIFELVQSLLDQNQPDMKEIVKNGLADLMYYIIFYMQLPQERVESWISNPTQFVLDDPENPNATYTLRTFAADLITVACDTYPAESYSGLGQAVERHLTSSVFNASGAGGTGAGGAGGVSDWKIQEACLFAVGSVGTRIVKPGSGITGATGPDVANPNSTAGAGAATGAISTENSFNIHGFIQNIVLPGLSSQDILLSGRCLVLGSNFCRVLSPDLINKFVQTAAEALSNPSSSVITKILALKAINTFVEEAQENLTVKMALLSVLPSTIEPLIHFATSQSVEILSDSLESISGILELDDGFTASVGNLITTLVISSFIKFNSDPVICPTLEGVVKILCQNPNVVGILQERFTPTIVSLLNATDDKYAGAQGVGIDLLTAIVRGSPTPLSPILINSAFPAVVQCARNSEDHTILQNAGECLRAYTSVAPAQIYEYRDAQGTSGLGHVVQLAIRLLDPNSSEFSAMFVGKIVTTLILKAADQLGDNLELLLRAVLSKLQSADTLSVIQNLVLVYCHLFNTQLEGTLTFLDNVPGPTGESALHFVLTEWVLRQPNFYGNFDRRLSCIALCKLLEHGVTKQDSRLSSITIRGDPIIDPKISGGAAGTRVTRSQTRAHPAPIDQWTQIPLLVKIWKVLIQELATGQFENEAEDSDGSWETSEDEEGSPVKGRGDRENDKENHAVGPGPGGLAGLPGIWDDCEYEDDQDDDLRELISTHPLYSVDLDTYLKSYLLEFSGHMYYPEFTQHLNTMEAKTLSIAGIPFGGKQE